MVRARVGGWPPRCRHGYRPDEALLAKGGQRLGSGRDRHASFPGDMPGRGDPVAGAQLAGRDTAPDLCDDSQVWGGRDRRAASHAERARLNVTPAIRAAMANLARANPSLGRHLAATIRTGRYCCYTPDPRAPITWER